MMRRNLTISSGWELVTNAYWEADPHPGTPVFKYPACSAYVGCTRRVVCSSRVPRRGPGMREGDKSSNGRWVESSHTIPLLGRRCPPYALTFSARCYQRINRSSDHVFRRLPELSILRSQIAVASWKQIQGYFEEGGIGFVQRPPHLRPLRSGHIGYHVGRWLFTRPVRGSRTCEFDSFLGGTHIDSCCGLVLYHAVYFGPLSL